MGQNNLSTLKILTIAIATGMASQVNAQSLENAVLDGSLKIKVQLESRDFDSEQVFVQRIKELLNQRGILSNGDIEIQAHLEDNTVDLVCFDCVIVNAEMAGVDQPLNKTGGGGF